MMMPMESEGCYDFPMFEDCNVISEEVKTAYEDSLGKSNCIKYPVTQENLDNLQRGQIGLLVGGFV